ncbi:MAG: tRNA (adenosine(37)-N6)-dimethylallyltransferase MiaA [Pseudomonadota bacterium]
MAEQSAYPAVFLMGPTASGKTDLAVALAARLPVDLISVDSALVYRRMDIGTAKPAPELLAQYPHALIDIRDPDQSYCAGDFRRDALDCLAASRARGRLPVLVGGTGLYFRALEQGLAEIPEVDPALRAVLDAEGRRLGWPALHRQLSAIDPQAAARIHPNDSQRIQRALAVFRSTGRTLSQWQAQQGRQAQEYRFLKLMLAPPRELLYQRIAERFAAMLRAGFVDEVAALRRQGYGPELPAMRAVGYRQLLPYVSGETTLELASAAAVQATRQLAKRQLTWLRGETASHLLPVAEGGQPLAAALSLIEACWQRKH